MKKIIFGITSLQIGGAERVLIDLVNKLCDKFDITIFTIYDNGKLKSQVNKKVKIISMYDKSFDDYSRLKKIKISLKLFFYDKPPIGYDTYVSFLEGPITRLFSKEKKHKKIAWIHNDISRVFGRGIKSKLKRNLETRVYGKYNEIIFVSKENQDDFNNLYGSNFNEDIINNYIDYERIIKKSEEKIPDFMVKKDIPVFITACRLTEQKALDRFIRVHKRLEGEGLRSQVFVLGEGELKEKLQNEIDECKVNDSFILLGAKTNPYPYIKQADYFCLFSYYEGYGMAIEEAKILNRRILITDTAAKECIEDYNKAQVFENSEDGIYEGLKQVILKKKTEKDFSDQKNWQEYYEQILEKVISIIE